MSSSGSPNPNIPSQEVIVRIASLAGPIGETVTKGIMRDFDLIKRIEKSEPKDILFEIMAKLGVIGPKPHDPERKATLKAFIDEKDEELKRAQNAGEEEIADALSETTDFVKEDSAIVKALDDYRDAVRHGSALRQVFDNYREAELEYWDKLLFEYEGFDLKIDQALDLGSVVVASAWKQAEGIE